MKRLQLTLAEGRRHVRRALGELEALRLQLIGIKLSLPETPRDPGVDDEVDAVTELRATLDCVLEDSIRPAIQDLQDVLGSAGAEEEEP